MKNRKKTKLTFGMVVSIIILLGLVISLVAQSLPEPTANEQANNCIAGAYGAYMNLAPAQSRLPLLMKGKIVGEIGHDPATGKITLYIGHLEYDSEALGESGNAMVRVAVQNRIVAAYIRACDDELYFIDQEMDAMNFPAFQIEFATDSTVYLNYP